MSIRISPADEETPLLTPTTEAAHNLVYKRFTPARKRTISALVSCSALIPLFAGASFIPSIPEIAQDLHSTASIISLAVSISIFSSALGSMVFATYSGFYGRRPMYLFGLPLLCIGSLGVAQSTRVTELMFWRFVQAFGSSGGMSVGGGVIADIYELTERGTAMGVFLAAALLGNALAPIVGGYVAHYASWRYLQFAISAFGALLGLAMFAHLPETSHPGSTGREKAQAAANKNNTAVVSDVPARWVWLNPFACLWLLRSPNITLLTLASAAVLLTEFGLQVPMAHTIGVRYGITNEALIGACFIPMGVGNIVGAPFAGALSDHLLIKWRARRGGTWVAEDRLRGALLGAALLVPLSILASGIITHFVDGPRGLVLNLVCFFINGIGADLVLSPASAYCVDVMHSRSAEVMAASAGLRAVFLSAAVASVLPSIDCFGVLVTDAGAACIAWAGFIIIWLVIRHGPRMRAWIDIGYSTAENN